MTTMNTSVNATIITVALDKLDADPKNVRKTYSTDGIKELAASIKAKGLLQNLVVRKGKKGRFLVTAGERRRRALTLLAEAGDIAADHAVNCVLREEEEATELSLAENVMREDMNAIDAYVAFTALADEGKPVTDIAVRFGTTEAIVRKRLALGRVSPALHDLYRQEEMTFDQLSAFTLADDHARQEAVWNSLPSWNRSASSIRNALHSEGVRASDKRIVFLGGLEAFEAAGGTVRRDLFSSNGGYATDVAVVERLVAERLAAEAATVKSEGWAWVECHAEMPRDAYDMRRVYAETIPLTADEEAELEALEAQYHELAGLIEEGAADDETEARLKVVADRMDVLQNPGELYQPTDIERAGAYICIDYYGKLRVERGLIRAGNDDDDARDSEAEATSDATTAKPFALSAALVQELTAQKTAAIRAELAHNPDVALAAVVHAMLLSIQNSYGSEATCLDLRLTSERLENSIKDPAECKGVQVLDDLSEHYGHRIPGNPADLWDWCLVQSRDELLTLLSFAAAKSVNALQLPHYARTSQRQHADKLASALKIEMTAWFTPTAGNYFGRISKTGIEEALADAKGADFASGVSGMKKAEAAAYAERQVEGSGWLPQALRLAATTPATHDPFDGALIEPIEEEIEIYDFREAAE